MVRRWQGDFLPTARLDVDELPTFPDTPETWRALSVASGYKFNAYDRSQIKAIADGYLMCAAAQETAPRAKVAKEFLGEITKDVTRLTERLKIVIGAIPKLDAKG